MFDRIFGGARPVGDYAREHLYYADQAGYIRDNPEFIIDRRGIDDYLFVHVVSGYFHTEIDGEKKTVSPGETVVINLKKPHRYYSDRAEPCEILWMDFNCTDDKMEPLTAVAGLPVIVKCPEHMELMRNFVEQYINNSAFGEFHQSQMIYRILLSTAAYLRRGEIKTPPEIHVIEDYISRNIHRKITLRELADVLHMSPCHFSHIFKERYGVPPIRHVTRRKMERALYLLTYSNLTVSEIADKLGFYSQSHFSAIFKKNMGQYPTGMRAAVTRTWPDTTGRS